jgi:lipopolysaccharide/colanic/teichoic acid biosynthesis glycosyltransferase
VVTKRAMDGFLAGLGLVLTAPVLLGIAIAVWVRSGSPVFYVATRAGLHGRPFALYKFRTMAAVDASDGPAVTIKGDPRITPVGRFLRRHKLDELPQLFNVVRGDMSLVGPRPEDPRYVALYTPAQRQVLDIKPGVTSLASVRYRREEELLQGPEWESRYLREIVPAKLRMEIGYADTRSLLNDLRVLVQTVTTLLHEDVSQGSPTRSQDRA